MSTFTWFNFCFNVIFSCSKCLICCCNKTWSLIEGSILVNCGEGGDETEEFVGYDQDLNGGGDEEAVVSFNLNWIKGDVPPDDKLFDLNGGNDKFSVCCCDGNDGGSIEVGEDVNGGGETGCVEGWGILIWGISGRCGGDVELLVLVLFPAFKCSATTFAIEFRWLLLLHAVPP